MMIFGVKASLIPALFLASLATEASAECRIERYRFMFGQETSTTMTVTTNDNCSSNVSVAQGMISDMRLSAPAKNGAASAAGARWGYKSKPGFKGNDVFVVAITGSDQHGSGTAKVTVNVTVK